MESEATDAGQPRLLIIEDEEGIRDILAELGQEAGYVVREAEALAAAKSAYHDFSPQLIILDLGLAAEPGHDPAEGDEGFQMLEFLAESQCEARIVIISGMSRRKRELNQVRGQGMNLKVIGHIPKPFDIDVVQKLLTDIRQRQP